MSTRTISIPSLDETVTVREHPRAKRLTLRLENDGKVSLTVPQRTPVETIRGFLRSKSRWIQRQRAKQAKQPWFGETEQKIWLFGNVLEKKYHFHPDHPAGVRLQPERKELLVNQLAPDHHPSHEKTHNTVQRFLKQTASHYFHKRIPKYAKQMEVKYEKIQFREQKTRWGSCSSRGTLSLNWRLVHAPTEIIDYLIVHELAHIIHPNHSEAFWNTVATFDSNFQENRNWLKTRRLRRFSIEM